MAQPVQRGHDIGIRYDAQRTATETETPSTSQQDALQVALRASFLNDRLEVEGAVGSREISQEALGETHLQNVRVLYHLNEDKASNSPDSQKPNHLRPKLPTPQAKGLAFDGTGPSTGHGLGPRTTLRNEVALEHALSRVPASILDVEATGPSTSLWPPEDAETP